MQVCPVIFGSSYFPDDTGSSLKRAPLKTKRPEAPPEGPRVLARLHKSMIWRMSAG